MAPRSSLICSMRCLRLCLLALVVAALAGPAGAGAHARWTGPIAHAAAIPNDPGRGTTPFDWQRVQWNFVGPFGVGAPAAWDNAAAAGRPGGKGVVIAVLDTGIAYANRGRFRRSPDLRASTFVSGFDFVDHDPYADDPNGHGTHVASTIAEATNNGIGLTGLAFGARIMPVRVLDSNGEGDAKTIAKGVRFAVHKGARIINLSLEFGSDATAGTIPALIKAINYAHSKGVVMVGASGNDSFGAVAYPARATYVISVGATTEHGCLADYSNQGRGLDLVAPGGGLDDDLPDDVNCTPTGGQGRDIAQVSYRDAARHFGIDTEEGTSMSVPHVSATAALIIASGAIGGHPSPTAILHRLEATARDLGPVGYDEDYGWGLIDAAAATSPGGPLIPPASSSSGGAGPGA
ncbi:MAG: serine protease [Solirubrobacteraceae bacterium]|nr:serine protease [Solirubrobacteraceae bacterium]